MEAADDCTFDNRNNTSNGRRCFNFCRLLLVARLGSFLPFLLQPSTTSVPVFFSLFDPHCKFCRSCESVSETDVSNASRPPLGWREVVVSVEAVFQKKQSVYLRRTDFDLISLKNLKPALA